MILELFLGIKSSLTKYLNDSRTVLWNRIITNKYLNDSRTVPWNRIITNKYLNDSRTVPWNKINAIKNTTHTFLQFFKDIYRTNPN